MTRLEWADKLLGKFVAVMIVRTQIPHLGRSTLSRCGLGTTVLLMLLPTAAPLCRSSSPAAAHFSITGTILGGTFLKPSLIVRVALSQPCCCFCRLGSDSARILGLVLCRIWGLFSRDLGFPTLS